jgi:DNA anti-recombination protein RmuC
MKRRIRRKSPLGQNTLLQAENLLSASTPPEMQQLLESLYGNLRNVHMIIDQQLQQTRALSARAYADLRSPTQTLDQPRSQHHEVFSSIEEATNELTPEVSQMMNEKMAEVQQHLGQINLAINQKTLTMTQAISERTLKVHASVTATQGQSDQEADAQPAAIVPD